MILTESWMEFMFCCISFQALIFILFMLNGNSVSGNMILKTPVLSYDFTKIFFLIDTNLHLSKAHELFHSICAKHHVVKCISLGWFNGSLTAFVMYDVAPVTKYSVSNFIPSGHTATKASLKLHLVVLYTAGILLHDRRNYTYFCFFVFLTPGTICNLFPFSLFFFFCVRQSKYFILYAVL
jgi:hypothetical protein